MSERLRPDERMAAARLHALLELLPTALDQRLAGFGLTAFEYSVLEALDEVEAGRLRLSALAAHTNASLPRLSRVVSSLERKGFVQRVPCEADGRATNAVITPDGADILDAARPGYTGALRALVLDAIGEDGTRELSELALRVLVRLDPDRRLAVTACAGRETAESAVVGAGSTRA